MSSGRTRALPLLAAAGLLGCGAGSQQDPPTSLAASEASRTGPGLQALEALGYAGYDESGPLDPVAKEQGAFAATSAEAPDQGPLLLTDERSSVQLIARDGEPLWSLHVPQRDAVELAEPLTGGRLLTLSVDQGVDLFSPRGEQLASWDLAAHHDLAVEADGGILVPVHREHIYQGRRVRFDSLVRLRADSASAPIELWSSHACRKDLLQLAGPSALDTPPPKGEGDQGHQVYDRFHLNSVQVLGPTELGRQDPRFRAGNLLLCLRNSNLLLILDRTSARITWSFGPGELDFPHHPSLLASGRILVFDNGWHRGWSRVLELDPRAPLPLTWTWRASPAEDFFSKTRGAAERLANGHTLVCDSESARLFELDASGAVAWTWRRPAGADGRRRRIYRATRPKDAWVQAVLNP